MEKMNYKRLYMRWILQRLEKLERLVEEKTEYVPIYHHHLKSKQDQQIQTLSLFETQTLEKLNFYTKSREERIADLKIKREKEIQQSFYWKERKLKQSLNLALQSNDEEILIKAKAIHDHELIQINKRKEQQLLDYLNGLDDKKIKSSQFIPETDYQALVTASQQRIDDFQHNSNQRIELKINRLQEKTNRQLIELNRQIKQFKEKLNQANDEQIQLELHQLELLKKKKDENLNHRVMVDHLESKIRVRDKNSNLHLSISHLTMTFSGLKAVDDLSFDVKKGSIFGLIGPNGAGKTTVFNCITQFYKPKSGDIYFSNNKNEVISLLDYPVHNIIKQGIVRTFQNVELIWELNILENMLVGAHTLYKSGFFTQLFHLPKLKREEEVIKRKALNILENLDLTLYKDSYPIGLPYGILKKIELARTLMTNPSLIILDEPAAGLNDLETKALAKTIREINKNYGCTIFLVEHDMDLVMDICDEICAISFGKKLAMGTPKEIQNHPLVREAYLGGE